MIDDWSTYQASVFGGLLTIGVTELAWICGRYLRPSIVHVDKDDNSAKQSPFIKKLKAFLHHLPGADFSTREAIVFVIWTTLFGVFFLWFKSIDSPIKHDPNALYEDLNGDGRGNPEVPFDPEIHTSKAGFVNDSSDDRDNDKCRIVFDSWEGNLHERKCNKYAYIELKLLAPDMTEIGDKFISIEPLTTNDEQVCEWINKRNIEFDPKKNFRRAIRTSKEGTVRLSFEPPENVDPQLFDREFTLRLMYIPDRRLDAGVESREIPLKICSTCWDCI